MDPRHGPSRSGEGHARRARGRRPDLRAALAGAFVCAAALAAAAALGACETLAGYDGRLPRPPAADDASTPPPAPDGASDAPPTVDAGLPATFSASCAALDGSCPPPTPYCAIYFDAGINHHTYSCVSAAAESAAPAVDVTCGVAPVECADGLACGYAWHAGYHCAKLCRTAADCSAARPFCNHPLTLSPGQPPISMCEACNPVVQGDCVGALDTCMVRSVTTEPQCGAVDAGAAGVGARCAQASDCQRGLHCVCRNAQGLGDDCVGATDGLCFVPCFPYQRGGPCPAPAGGPSPGACKPAGAATLYSYCAP